MPKKRILLITDEARTEAGVREALSEYDLEAVKNVEAALALINSLAPDLVVIDFELKEMDGLRVFRQVRLKVPGINAIMLSASNDIPLAVTATKLGVSDFLRKPVNAQLLRESVGKNLAVPEGILLPPSEIGWMQGESAGLKKMYSEIKQALASSSRNLVLLGEPGIRKKDVAAYIHAHSLKKKRSLRVIDLSSFQRGDLEAHFWASLQEIMAMPEAKSLPTEEDRCGTLYLEKIGSLDGNFRTGIFKFGRERRENVDREILLVIGVCSEAIAREAEGYLEIEVPPLRARKEDLPFLLNYYLKHYSARYNKPARGFSADALDFLALYDYPGNYLELEGMVEQAVLLSASDLVELKDIAMDFVSLRDVSAKKSLRQGKPQLKEARKEFEKDLYGILLAKSGGNTAAIARFLDMPRTALSERMRELGCNPAD
jgi:DNA-binding NtrC family response regulator